MLCAVRAGAPSGTAGGALVRPPPTGRVLHRERTPGGMPPGSRLPGITDPWFAVYATTPVKLVGLFRVIFEDQ